MEEAHGEAWGRRANQWLMRHAPRSASAGAELLSKAADRLYLQGQLEEALAAYDDAAQQAVASQNDAAAFELGYKAALVEQQRKAYAAAAERLRKLALKYKTLPTASEAHRQAAWNLAQALRGNAAPAEEYATVLAEHLETWPKGEPADQVRIWLGRFLESRQAWEQSLAIYRDVPRSSPHFADALSGVIRADEQYLAELQTSGAATDAASRAAIAYYQRAITGNSDRLPENWSTTDGQAAVAAARIVLSYRTSGYDGAELLLQAALAGLPDAQETWKQEAQILIGCRACRAAWQTGGSRENADFAGSGHASNPPAPARHAYADCPPRAARSRSRNRRFTIANRGATGTASRQIRRQYSGAA
jgi:tetratricopeptide (TPR) repeat protein